MKPVVELPRNAYATFLAGDGDFVKGVVGLAKGLRKVKTAYPLIVAVLPDVPDEHCKLLVDQCGCIVREIEPLDPPADDTSYHYARADYAVCYSKLRMWEFVEYDRLVYLDADTQVYENIDHLFDLPNEHFYAVISCFCSPWWNGTPQYEIGYCQQLADKVEWPVERFGPPPSTYFNVGFYVFEPSIPVYDDILEQLKVFPLTLFPEQDFLNKYFKDKFKPLPIEYNMLLFFLWQHPDKVVDVDKVKVVHYCAPGSKPWWYTGKEENMDREDVKMMVQRWRDIYEDPSLDYKPIDAPMPSTA